MLICLKKGQRLSLIIRVGFCQNNTNRCNQEIYTDKKVTIIKILIKIDKVISKSYNM